jgi:hypothetical protein
MKGQRLYLPKTGCVSLKNLIERDGLSDGKTEAMMSEREGQRELSAKDGATGTSYLVESTWVVLSRLQRSRVAFATK